MNGTQEMLDAIRKAVGVCEAPEIVVLEALMDEAEGWRMRIAELEAEDADGAP